MKTYQFGTSNKCDRPVEIKALNFDHAVKVFSIQELFPEKCVSRKYIREQTYSSALKRYLVKFKSGLVPVIPVYEKKDGELVLVSEIPLSLVLDVDYESITGRDRKLLVGTEAAVPKPEETQEDDGEPETHLQVFGGRTCLMSFDKRELRKKHDEIMQKKAELEELVFGLNQSVHALQDELKRKIELVYAIETYLGVKEEVVRLMEGAESAADEPLAVYQQVLYMDEEVGAWDDDGIDFQRIEEFDAWIKKNFKKILYRDKSVCAFRVRREDKVYAYGNDLAAAWTNVTLNEENHKTYFLIRNGESLYRIWGNVSISGRMFPRKDEYDKIIKKAHIESWSRKEIEARHKAYLMGLIYLQGLIERTPILGPNLKYVNLVTGKFTDAQVVLIRDDEQNQWIGDGKPSWEEFIKANRESIALGTRVIISQAGWTCSTHNDDRWRMAPYRCAHWPKNDEIYTVEDFRDKNQERYYNWEFLVRYSSGDEIWNKEEREYQSRQHRVPFRLYRDEVINFDAITVEQCDYYQKNRYERKNYLRILPALHWIRKQKKQERALEEEFVKLVQGMLSWPEGRIAEIHDAIAWWKLKNKWKRGLMKDDAKAVRMIVKKLKNTDVVEEENGSEQNISLEGTVEGPCPVQGF